MMIGIEQARKIRMLVTEQVELLHDKQSFFGILKIRLKILAMATALKAVAAVMNY